MWDIFLSHASENKRSVARHLKAILEDEGISIFYDEDTVILGNSLKGEIDKGLSNSKNWVLVLSPDFFRKGWTRYELDRITSLSRTRKRALLPVWHRVDYEGVASFSPELANIVGINTSCGIDKVAAKIISRIGK